LPPRVVVRLLSTFFQPSPQFSQGKAFVTSHCLSLSFVIVIVIAAVGVAVVIVIIVSFIFL
jgi:hypothetical protein